MAVVTRKNQITIPKKIRESLNIEEGDRVELVKNERCEYILKKVTRDKEWYIKALKQSAGILKMEKKEMRELQGLIGESMRV